MSLWTHTKTPPAARLKLLADKGSKGAATAIRLAEDPGRFLSSVQIGITLVGILAGAFSGATLGARLAASLLDAGMPPAFAQPVGVGSVVVAITYLSLIVGELVPKQIALRAPEQVAARVAPMMRIIARVAAPLVSVLDRSGKLVLALLGQSGSQSRGVSDEEVRLIIAEAESSGAMNQAEPDDRRRDAGRRPDGAGADDGPARGRDARRRQRQGGPSATPARSQPVPSAGLGGGRRQHHRRSGNP